MWEEKIITMIRKCAFLTLFIGLTYFVFACSKRLYFKDLFDGVNLHTLNYPTTDLLDEYESVDINNALFTAKINNALITKVFDVERIEDRIDLSGVKNNKIFYVKVYSNGCIETSEGIYYKLLNDNSLYNELIKEFSN